jgi:hypothetical protein
MTPTEQMVVETPYSNWGTKGDEHLQLFSSEAYNRLNLTSKQQYLRLDHHASGRLLGTFVGIVEDGMFWSGYRAPFCGPDFVRKRETPDNVQAVIDHALDSLSACGIQRMRVKARPASYSPNETYVQHGLMRRGFDIANSELSYGIDLGSYESRAEYRASLKRSARRAVGHSDGQPFDYREAHTADDWAVAYDLIRANRTAKGNPLQLSLEYLLSLRAGFGDRIRFFVLSHAGQPVASALLYRLRPDIELVEYWGDSHDLGRSPMNRLAEEVCGRAIDEGVRLVDLGISSVEGSPDAGLIQFKQSIGATAELRLSFERSL